jgi:ribosomal subunit interface protein
MKFIQMNPMFGISLTRLTWSSQVAGFFVFWLWQRTRFQESERSFMDVIVTSKTLHVTQALKAAAIRQAEKLLRFGKHILRVRISLEAVARKKNDMFSTIVQYHIELPGRTITVRRKASDMYEALVDAASSAARQVRKVKERQLYFRHGYRSAYAPALIEDYDLRYS